MALSFEELKKNRGKKALESLSSELKKLSPGVKEADERIWYPEVDKVGNGYAVIRFLPAPVGEVSPFIRVYNHSFKGPSGLWYIENSLTTIGQDDPVGNANRQYWNSGTEADKEKAKAQNRRSTFYSNILVIKDPAKPENEGKVFIFKYGVKIFDKIKAKTNPASSHDEPLNVFDLWEGNNLKVKIRQVAGFRNYDESEWESSSAIANSEEKIQKIWEGAYPLKEFLDSKNYKTFDELKAHYEKVTGNSSGSDKPALKQESGPKLKEKASAKLYVSDSDTEDEADFLKRLTQDD